MRRVNQGRWIAVVVLAVGGVLVSSHGGAGKWLAGLLLASLGVLLGRILWLRWAERSREAFVKDYRFPPGLARKLRDTYPHLSEGQAEMVLRELRNFFHVARAVRGQMVSMPSQAVDVAWHEFILFTRGYRLFCRQALGRFLDHTPASGPRPGRRPLNMRAARFCRRSRLLVTISSRCPSTMTSMPSLLSSCSSSSQSPPSSS